MSEPVVRAGPWCAPGVSCERRWDDPIGQRCKLVEAGAVPTPCVTECSILAENRRLLKLDEPELVAWSTPQMKATRLLYEIGEDLEFKRVGDAMKKVALLLAEIRALVRFVQKHPDLIYRAKEPQ